MTVNSWHMGVGTELELLNSWLISSLILLLLLLILYYDIILPYAIYYIYYPYYIIYMTSILYSIISCLFDFHLNSIEDWLRSNQPRLILIKWRKCSFNSWRHDKLPYHTSVFDSIDSINSVNKSSHRLGFEESQFIHPARSQRYMEQRCGGGISSGSSKFGNGLKSDREFILAFELNDWCLLTSISEI